MLYWRSNTGTTTCIDYTNGACYIGRATLEQQYLLIIPTEHGREHVMFGATLKQQHLLIIPIRHWTKHVILLSNTGTTISIDIQRSNGRNMLYLWSNTVTTACIDYTNEALDKACYIGRATLEQQHVLIIPTKHWTEHVILAEQHWNNSIY